MTSRAKTKRRPPRTSTRVSTSNPKHLPVFPPEVLGMIIEQAPISALPSLRAACKQMGEIATNRLFKRLWISPAIRDQIRITKVAAHPQLSKLVKELAYDGTNPIKSPPNRPHLEKANESYYGHIGTTLPRDTSVSLGDTKSKNIVAASGKRGYVHQQVLKDQYKNMLRFSDMDLSSSKVMGNKLFQSLLDQPNQYQYILHYLVPDLVALISNMSAFVNLKSFVISDTRYTADSGRLQHRLSVDVNLYDGNGNPQPESQKRDAFVQNITYRFKDSGVQGKETILVDPIAWPDNRESFPQGFDGNHYRGLSVLFQAASMIQMPSVESFIVERNSEYGGLSSSALVMTCSRHMKRAMQYLRKIDLKLNTEYPPSKHFYRSDDYTLPCSWEEIINGENFAEGLEAATHLQELKITLDAPTPVYQSCQNRAAVSDLKKLVGTHTWAALHSVTFGYMTIDEKQLLAFLGRHRGTLRHFADESGVNQWDEKKRALENMA